MARVNIFLDEGLLEEVDREARQSGTRRSALVQRALREFLDRMQEAREEEERKRIRTEASERMDRLAEHLGSWDAVKAVREGRERRVRVRR